MCAVNRNLFIVAVFEEFLLTRAVFDSIFRTNLNTRAAFDTIVDVNRNRLAIFNFVNLRRT